MQHADVSEFLTVVTPYLSWWNVKSRYAPESVLSPAKQVMREALISDTFSIWFVAQAKAFAQNQGYLRKEGLVTTSGLIKGLVNGQANINRAAVTLKKYQVVSFEDLPQENHEKLGFLRIHHPQVKGIALAFWEIYKGYKKCDDVQEADVQQALLERKWWERSEWTSKLTALTHIRSKYRCVDRVTTGVSSQDMVQMGLQRYFYLGKGKYAQALDWDVETNASYDKAFLLYDEASDKIQLPGGTPRGPFAEDSKPNPCGEFCLWQYPIPPIPQGGYNEV